jgi:hypothetical protein
MRKSGARRALVLALALVMGSCVTHGVRTTPSKLIVVYLDSYS